MNSRTLRKWARTWLCKLFLTCGVLWAAQLMAQPDFVKRWFMEEYVQSYLNDAPDFYTAHYTAFVHFVTPGSAEMLSLDRLIASMNVTYVEPWVAKGWEDTSAISAEVRMLSEETYLLTAEWSMTDANGDPVTHCARPVWHYLITTAGGARPRIFSEIQGACLE